MVISEIALGLFINFLYDSFKSIPQYISDTSSKVYDRAIEDFSNQNYKLNGTQINKFFRQKNVENAIKKYLKNPDKLDCSNILINEFFELFSEEDFSREDADLILNSFFEMVDAEIEKEPELRDYLILNFVKKTDKTTQEINQGVKELSKDVTEISHNVQEIKEVINGGRENQDKKESGVDFEESLEKYLNKIIDDNENKEINEIYTELSAKEILPVTLKFRETESDISREYEVLELVEKEEKLIISGESGSGKTTTLRWLNYILAKSYLEGKNEKIPLYIELNSYINEERFIKKPFDAYVAMKAKKNGISEDILETILKEKTIILLDGFDLLSPTDEFYPYDKISNFITDYNNCRFVISSRPGFFESIKSFKVSELEKLTDEKIEIFINRYVSSEELVDTLKDEILSNEQLKSILSNPMMLFIAIKIATGKKDESGDLLPSNRSELYEAFISTLFNHQNDKGKRLHANRIQIENALTDLYFKLQCRNEVSCKCSEALKFVKKSFEDPLFKEISPQLILEDCSNLGILYKNDNYVSYGIHQSFQEYFAAIKLKELFENGYDVSEAFSHPKWEEVVIFTSEMLDSDFIDEFIDLMVSKGDFFLASKCLNKASNNTKEKLCALLAEKLNSKYKLEKINSIESLGRMGTNGANAIVKVIPEALKDKDLMWSVTHSLKDKKTNLSINKLISLLKDENKFVQVNVADALGDIKTEKAVEPLVSLLKENDKDVKWSAVCALGRIKTHEAVEHLITLLKNEDEIIRESAAGALGEAKAEEAIELLVNILKDKNENKYVRWRSACTLGYIGAEEAIEPLVNILRDKDEDKMVQSSAEYALGNMKTELTVETLISLLKDEHENKYVRLSAAHALAETKPEETIELLINWLKDEDYNVRRTAAFLLGYIEAEVAVKSLVNLLKDDNKDVRITVVYALERIKSKEAVEPLLSLLNDEDKDVKKNAIDALGEIKAEEAIEPLIRLLKDEREDKNIKWLATRSLGCMKREEAVKPLIIWLKDKDEDQGIRGTAAFALGDIKTREAVDTLISVLKDKSEDEILRTCVSHALGNIKTDEVVETLINIMKNENVWWIADSLRKVCTAKNKKQLEELLKSENELSSNTAFEILYEIEKEERSKVILFKDEKFLRI